MATVAHSHRENGKQMKKVSEQAEMPAVVDAKKRAPVRVKLKRIDCNQTYPHPPDGTNEEWWQRLKDALGRATRRGAR
jgi:hypothetical protein